MQHLFTSKRFIGAAIALVIGFTVHLAEAGSSSHGSHDKTVTVNGAFARATIGAGRNGTVYLSIHNPTSRPDRLIGARTEVAKHAKLHTHLHENGVMKMRPIDGVKIPAHGRTELKPGGDHLMLMGLSAPLKMGDNFSVILVFEEAGEISVMVKIGPVDAKSVGHGNHKN